MPKIVDLNKPVRDLITQYPEVAQIMKELGFESITNPAMFNIAGRIMTLKKGSAMKNIELAKIKESFEAKGFEVVE